MTLPVSQTLLVCPEKGILHITLNRPESRNSMSLQMVQELQATFEWATNNAIRAVVLRGAGGHFCAGGDIRDMMTIRQQATDNPQAYQHFNRTFGHLLTQVNSAPFVVVTVYSRLKGFDVRMLEAAKDLGASEVTILRKIILPLAMPAVAAGWLLSFTLSMDDVVVSSFVTGPGYEILPLKIYSMVKVGVSPEVNALATILLVLSLVMVIASQLIARDKTKGR